MKNFMQKENLRFRRGFSQIFNLATAGVAATAIVTATTVVAAAAVTAAEETAFTAAAH